MDIGGEIFQVLRVHGNQRLMHGLNLGIVESLLLVVELHLFQQHIDFLPADALAVGAVAGDAIFFKQILPGDGVAVRASTVMGSLSAEKAGAVASTSGRDSTAAHRANLVMETSLVCKQAYRLSTPSQ